MVRMKPLLKRATGSPMANLIAMDIGQMPQSAGQFRQFSSSSQTSSPHTETQSHILHFNFFLKKKSIFAVFTKVCFVFKYSLSWMLHFRIMYIKLWDYKFDFILSWPITTYIQYINLWIPFAIILPCKINRDLWIQYLSGCTSYLFIIDWIQGQLKIH